MSVSIVTEWAVRYADGEQHSEECESDAIDQVRHAEYRFSIGDEDFAGAHVVSRTITTTEWK